MADSEGGRRRSPIRRSIVLGLLAGLVVGTLVAVFIVRRMQQDSLPELTVEGWQAARDRWQARGPDNYNIEVRVIGTQPAVYRVEVRDGQAQSAQRNGNALTQRRTFGTWSVPGMFGTMSRDVDHLQRRLAGTLEPQEPRLTLLAEFDPEYGYPRKYNRIQWGSNVEVAWEVIRFEAVAD